LNGNWDQATSLDSYFTYAKWLKQRSISTNAKLVFAMQSLLLASLCSTWNCPTSGHRVKRVRNCLNPNPAF